MLHSQKKKDITHRSVLCINPGAHYLIPRSVCVWERVLVPIHVTDEETETERWGKGAGSAA